jgi:hypothetical protein
MNTGTNVTITARQAELVEEFLEVRRACGSHSEAAGLAAMTLAIEWESERRALEEERAEERRTATHQAIVTLPDGQQVSVWSSQPISADTLSVKYRRSPGGMWDPDVNVGSPHGRPTHPTIHFGSW